MKTWTLLAFVLAAMLMIPSVSALAEEPNSPTSALLISTETPTESPAEPAAKPPATAEETVDLDQILGSLNLPEQQKKIRLCDDTEAAAAGCDEERCLWVNNRAWCF